MIREQGVQGDTKDAVGIKAGSSFTFTIFPNPVQNKLTVQINNAPAGNVKFVIRNVNGSVEWQKNVLIPAGQSSKTIDISQLAAGTYFFSLQTREGEITRSMIKQ